MYAEVSVQAASLHVCDVFLIGYSFPYTDGDTPLPISSQMHRNLFAYHCENSITSAVYHSDLSLASIISPTLSLKSHTYY